MKVEHQIRAFEQLLGSYDGVLPLHRYLFAYFKQNKQMGSSDRRWATRYLYSYFRLGKALGKLKTMERLAIADFLCNETPSLMVASQLPELEASFALPVADKIAIIQKKYPAFKLTDVFTFKPELSAGIDAAAFYTSFFVQPDLFIRVKETHIQAIINQLTAQGVTPQEVGPATLALPNGTKLEQLISDERLYQVQDFSSQLTGNYFEPQAGDYWWDCCAASGGKSLLLHSLEPQIELLVSDVRATSLGNLQERFQLAGIKQYHQKVIDLLQNNDQVLHHYEFDGILVDAPCSGSGTWGRTPEMLCFFENYKVENYNKLQKAIAGSVVKYLKKGKPLIYMTCSVFKAENEDMVDYLTKNFDLKFEKMELIKGYAHKADSMFVARLIKQ
ncbi:RsmB/NOP family class I SAM-dependent RNA methyltransferase [Pedobacter sp. KR3-3]|uniref:RsmB/NOP family class I SAM-dependent RNA methyltransferase n=1 Tax=Pedobacter albus TaxID=3113905 RepID=A0ABU7I818_9SPHI|nr:RsmB/NOP family class I SAM-dependent RNA methyltransferase [Pedobacter sp. KR3-3]MEE1945446.1 RsmB/NOP family class I SAM-dependent RNA methyltransferase [Pedobacter sp. KR3-3]